MLGTFIPRRLRRTSLVGLSFLVLLPLYAVVHGATPLHATSGGDAYSVPQVVDTNPDPDIVETTITAEQANLVDIGNGVTANVFTFNGSIPGPEFHLKVNDTVIVHFENQLPFPTGIHWHGIELDNASDGTPLTQNMVEPNHKFLYKFKVIRPGVFWYHPHHHSSTNQVFKGMYGSLIVANPADATLQGNVLPSVANTKTLLLSDITVCKAPGSNDAVTYDSSLPWAGGGPLPVQQAPHPTDLCDTPIDENGAKIESPPGTPTPLNEHDVPNIQRTTGPSNEGQTVLTNGKNVGGRGGDPSAPGALAAGAETLPVTAGDGVRFQVINAAPIRYMRLRLTDSLGAQIKLVRVGGEGGLLDAAVTDGTKPLGFEFDYEDGEIVLGPGERADVVAAIPLAATGVATMWTLDFKRQGTGGNGGQRFVNIPTVPVAHLAITGPPAASQYSISNGTPLLTDPSVGGSVEVLPAPTGGFLDPTTFSPVKTGMASQDIQLTATGSGSDTGINNIKGSHDFAGIDYTAAGKVGSSRYAAEVGDTLELTVTNTTAAHHPFHPHGFSMQPLTIEKPMGTVVYTFPHDFQDTVDVPNNSTLRYRVRLDDRPLMDGTTMGGATGRWVFHCHIFFHAVFGMISEIIVTDSAGNERPYVNADDVETAAVNKGGDVATMTGTLFDTDGDAITLQASKGAVTDNGDGTWSWSYTTDNSGGQGGLVYITATDAGGKKDQAAFELDVNNAPPDLAAIGDKASNENDLVSVSSTFTDADAGDVHTGTIDWGDGTTDTATIVEGTPGTLSGSHTYGDDGTFHASATVTDGDDSDTETFDVVVSNVNPDGNIDETGTVLVNGVPTFFADVGQSIPFTARITDPGSDDLFTKWIWGDGSPDALQTSYANGVSPDPDVSTDVNPRDINHAASHTFSGACFYTVTFNSADDDTGTDTDSVAVVITGTPKDSHGAGYWQTAYQNRKGGGFTTAQLNCFLAIAAFYSKVFNETRDASTIPIAYNDIFVAGLKGDMRQQLDRQLLTAWVNFANGGVEYNELLDTDGNGTLDTTFANVMATAETVRNNLASTKAQLQAQRDILVRINGRDGG
jgi:FtsP/CotA-like multicopper oxidase with cupredoxin domain